VCGIRISRCGSVGAGAVVIRDVPAYAMVVGNPGRQIGFMCECGTELPPRLVYQCGNRFEKDGLGLRRIAAA
jgi:UDP-2-acetamido-3-amino-2,3-dideoxy-glucuronate N-acetyltransferase